VTYESCVQVDRGVILSSVQSGASACGERLARPPAAVT
jgi:hypothetical protein